MVYTLVNNAYLIESLLIQCSILKLQISSNVDGLKRAFYETSSEVWSFKNLVHLINQID